MDPSYHDFVNSNNSNNSNNNNDEWLPRPFRYPHREASGLALDSYARGHVLMASMFLGPALLRLATEAAGCDPDAEDVCQNRVYGFRPSSLLSNIAIAAGLVSTVSLPLFGAIVDHTSYRKQVGMSTAVGLVIVKATEIAVGAYTWFIVAILQVVSSLLYGIHVTATYAYTCELTDDVAQRTRYNTNFFIVLYVATLVFMVVVLTVSALLHTDDVGTARVSQTYSSSMAAIFFYMAWRFCFGERSSLRQVPHGMSLVGCGFRKIAATAALIVQRDEYCGLKWIMISIMFAEAGTGALITVATTYLTQVLKMNSNEIGLVFLIVVITGIPGSKLGELLALRFRSPIRSAQCCDLFFVVSTFFAAKVLNGPDDKRMCYLFAVLWGVGLGWLPPIHTTAIISLIPRGSEAEFMGMYLVAGQVLSWLPPLVFTMLNEAGWPMSFGLTSLNAFFLLGLAALFALGNYDDAIVKVRSLTIHGAEIVPQNDDDDESYDKLAEPGLELS